jgi:hypothetical protein
MLSTTTPQKRITSHTIDKTLTHICNDIEQQRLDSQLDVSSVHSESS